MPRDWPEPRIRWWRLILPTLVTLAGAVSLVLWLLGAL